MYIPWKFHKRENWQHQNPSFPRVQSIAAIPDSHTHHTIEQSRGHFTLNWLFQPKNSNIKLRHCTASRAWQRQAILVIYPYSHTAYPPLWRYVLVLVAVMTGGGEIESFPLVFFFEFFVLGTYYQYQGRPLVLQSTSATSGLWDFLLLGTQILPWFSGRGKKTTSAMARWHWLDGRPCKYHITGSSALLWNNTSS